MKNFIFIGISTFIISINAQVFLPSDTAFSNGIESSNTAFKLEDKETFISTSSTVNFIEVAHTKPIANLDLVRTAIGNDIEALDDQDNKTQKSKVHFTDSKLKLVSYDFGTSPKTSPAENSL